MKEGPDIAAVAALIGDPARSNMLVALLDGRALTATELAAEAGVTKQTAASHLGKLVEARLLSRAIQGRHHYFKLAGPDVARAMEGLLALAQVSTGRRARPGPRDPALRRARICYDHLAGEMGVAIFEHMRARGWLVGGDDTLEMTDAGRRALRALGLSLPETTGARRRPLCRPCLDWSERRKHLGGAVGKAILDHILASDWAKRSAAPSRVLTFSAAGENALDVWLGRDCDPPHLDAAPSPDA